MSGWAWFWSAVLAVGIGAFLLMALVVVPLGLRDVVRLLRTLREGGGR